MRKRLFVAINLPDEIKEKIKEIVGQIQPLFDGSTPLTTGGEIRFLKPETWHITITFLGYQPLNADLRGLNADQRGRQLLAKIIESIKTTVKNFKPPLIEFDKVIFGPPGKKPRMIWVVGDKKSSEMLGKIKNTLEDEFVKNGIKFQRENRPYNTHLTLARFNSILGTSDVLNIEQKLRDIGCPKIEFIVESLDLMESHLKRTGAEYKTLVKVDFKQ